MKTSILQYAHRMPFNKTTEYKDNFWSLVNFFMQAIISQDISIYENLDFEWFDHYWETEIYDIFPETPVIQTDKKWQKNDEDITCSYFYHCNWVSYNKELLLCQPQKLQAGSYWSMYKKPSFACTSPMMQDSACSILTAFSFPSFRSTSS